MSDALDRVWDTKRLAVAKLVAEWSKDEAKVGAVIADHKGRVIALGYNGFAGGVVDNLERLSDTDQKLDMIVHAEVNAILIAGQSAKDGTLYVVGKPVCARCAGVVIQAGIKRVVAENPVDVDPPSKWTATGRRAIEMFREAGVTFVPII